VLIRLDRRGSGSKYFLGLSEMARIHPEFCDDYEYRKRRAFFWMSSFLRFEGIERISLKELLMLSESRLCPYCRCSSEVITVIELI